MNSPHLPLFDFSSSFSRSLWKEINHVNFVLSFLFVNTNDFLITIIIKWICFVKCHASYFYYCVITRPSVDQKLWRKKWKKGELEQVFFSQLFSNIYYNFSPFIFIHQLHSHKFIKVYILFIFLCVILSRLQHDT